MYMKKITGGNYVRLDDNVSFQLVETNPVLTTNIKLMYDNSNMFLETYNTDNIDNTNKSRIYPNGFYNKDLIKFWSKSKKIDFTNLGDVYKCKIEKIPYKYGYTYGFIAPLYLKEKLPERFVVFRLDGKNEKIEKVYDAEPDNVEKHDLIFENLIITLPGYDTYLKRLGLSIDMLKTNIGLDENWYYKEIKKRLAKHKPTSQLKVSDQFKNDIFLCELLSKYKKRIEEKRSQFFNDNKEFHLYNILEYWLCAIVIYNKLLNKHLDVQSPLNQYAYYCYKYDMSYFIDRLAYYNKVLLPLYNWKYRKYGSKIKMVKKIESIYRFYSKTKYNDIEDYYIFLNNKDEVELLGNKNKILQKSSIVKIFDLSDKSTLGTYIRNYINQENFKFDKSIKTDNDTITCWGIDKSGNFKSIISPIQNDLDIMYTYSQNVIFPYILNIEFMFNDNDDMLSGKYYGMYCNTIDLYEIEYECSNNVRNIDYKLNKTKDTCTLSELPQDKLEDDDKKCKHVIKVQKVENRKNVFYSDGESLFYIKDRLDNIYKLPHHQDFIYGRMYLENKNNFTKTNKVLNRYLKDYYGFDKVPCTDLTQYGDKVLINYVDPSDVFDWVDDENLLGYKTTSIPVECKRYENMNGYSSSLGFFVNDNPYNGTSIDIKITNKNIDKIIPVIENKFILDHFEFKLSKNKSYLIYGENNKIKIKDNTFIYKDLVYKFNDDFSEVISLYRANEIQLTARDEIITHIHDIYFEHVYPDNNRHGDGCDHTGDDFHDNWNIDEIMKGKGNFPIEGEITNFGNSDEKISDINNSKDIFDNDILSVGGKCPLVGIGIIYKHGKTTYPITFIRYDVMIDGDNYRLVCKECDEPKRINETTVFKEDIIYNRLLTEEEKDLQEYIRFYDKNDKFINEIRIYAPEFLYRNKTVSKATINGGEVILHLKSKCPFLGIGLVYRKNNKNMPISYRKYDVEWKKEKEVLRFTEIRDERIDELSFDIQKTIEKLLGQSEPEKYVKLYSDISDITNEETITEFRIYDPNMYLTHVDGNTVATKILENGEIHMRIKGSCPYVGVGVYRKNNVISKYVRYSVSFPNFNEHSLELHYDENCGEKINDMFTGEFTSKGNYSSFNDVEYMSRFIIEQGIYGKDYTNFDNYIRTYTKDENGFDIEIRLYVPEVEIWQDIVKDNDKGAYDKSDLDNYKYILRCDNYKHMFITTVMKPGTYHIARNKRIYFSSNGTKNDVAKAITHAINSYPYYSKEIEAYRNKNLIILKHAIKGSKYNGERQGVKIDVTFDGTYIYKNKISFLTDQYNRNGYTFTFTGGTYNSDNIFLIPNSQIERIINDEGKERFIKTSKGQYSRIKSLNPYLDGDNIPHLKTSVMTTDKYGKNISSGFNRIQLHEQYYPKLGVLSFFPIKELKNDIIYVNQSDKEYENMSYLMVPRYRIKNNRKIEIKYDNDIYIPYGVFDIDYNERDLNNYVKKWTYHFMTCNEQEFDNIFTDKINKYETITGNTVLFRNVRFSFIKDYTGYKFTFLFIPYFNKKDTFINEPYYIKNDMCKTIFGFMFINVYDDNFTIEYLNNISSILDDKFKNEQFINNLTIRNNIKNDIIRKDDEIINTVVIDDVKLFKIGLFDINDHFIDWKGGIKITSVVFDKVLIDILKNKNIDIQVKVYNGESIDMFNKNQYILENVKTINDIRYNNGILSFPNQEKTKIIKGYESNISISFIFMNVSLDDKIINNDTLKDDIKNKFNIYKSESIKLHGIVNKIETIYTDYQEFITEDKIKFKDMISLTKSFSSSNTQIDEENII